METNIPSSGTIMSSLLRADFTTQWRNRRSVILVLLVPVIILISWKPLIRQFGGAFVLSNCITVGLVAIGLMGYSTSIARDRDKGIFQRLRAAPAPSWFIMASRLMVQLVMIILLTTAVFIVGKSVDEITVSPVGYACCFLASLLGGAVYLGLGQLIVGLIKNPETVNSTVRLIYFIFIMIGMFGELGMLGQAVSDSIKYSPYGVVKHVVATSLEPSKWTSETTTSLLLTVGYAVVFAAIGIKKFKWNTK